MSELNKYGEEEATDEGHGGTAGHGETGANKKNMRVNSEINDAETPTG